ncbi:hypothetical protein KKD19_03470 [Patescibacteria group bacterium]|nr:hypothetical protein [Patescibacteria group bacterium]MBU4512275.1 hypothetical protein [Patescibacteria group bacterium]MCG2693275.1 hypothetical protein [Candidatus Parcubacteria bacterium]
MCIQSYYNYKQEQDEIELDLLSEIKEFGVDEWNKRTKEARKKINKTLPKNAK